MLLTLFFVSLVGGFCSGLIGVGGAVVLIPLMSAIPPLVGVGHLEMTQITALTMMQVFAACLSGWLAHRKGGNVHPKALLTIGIPMGLCAFAGGFLSKHMPSREMRVVFGVLVVLALMMLLRKHDHPESDDDPRDVPLHPLLAPLVGGGVGTMAGIVGAGGGFILIPLLTNVLKLPMRLAVGSSLGILLLGSIGGGIGKITSGQVEWLLVIPVVLGAVPAARLGARVSHRLSHETLRIILLVLVLFSLGQTWWKIARSYGLGPAPTPPQPAATTSSNETSEGI